MRTSAMTRLAAVVVAGIALCCSASMGFAQPPRPGPGQGPPRNARPTKTGNSVIRGRIFAADTGKPLRRARISVQAAELGGDGRTTSTNAEGRYEIKDLPAGRYTIVVNRSGYLQLRYGQRRPFEQGKQLQLLERQQLENVDFTLPRMSLITGRVFDEANEPIAGVRVMAMRSVFFEGRRRLVPSFGGPPAMTDDAGQYRILGLSPGSYFVTAETRETWTVNDGGVEQVMGYAQTYFPGVVALTEARRITVGVGQEMANQDLALVPGRAATVNGTASDSLGRPLAGRNVGVSQEYRGPGGFAMSMIQQGASINADGTFTIKNISPGEYKLVIRATVDRDGASVQEMAALPIVVNGADIQNVTLMTSTGWSIAGRVGRPEMERGFAVRSFGRPDQGGQYQIRGLPPGDYLAAAVDYVEEGCGTIPSISSRSVPARSVSPCARVTPAPCR